MKTVDQQYAELIKACLDEGEEITTRNSRVRRVYGKQVRFESTPLVSVRKTAWKSALREWEWFLSGSDNIQDLHPSVHKWWEPWAADDGRIKFNYSHQLRHYAGRYDQVASFVYGIKHHPFSRRNVLTTWNPEEMSDPACPITNCHNTVTQAFVDQGGRLSLVTYQRSADVICGLPANWIQMAAFQLWLVSEASLGGIGSLTWIGGDIHLYEDHFELAREIVSVADSCPPTPILVHTTKFPPDGRFKAEDFKLEGEYKPVLDRTAKMIV